MHGGDVGEALATAQYSAPGQLREHLRSSLQDQERGLLSWLLWFH